MQVLVSEIVERTRKREFLYNWIVLWILFFCEVLNVLYNPCHLKKTLCMVTEYWIMYFGPKNESFITFNRLIYVFPMQFYYKWIKCIEWVNWMSRYWWHWVKNSCMDGFIFWMKLEFFLVYSLLRGFIWSLVKYAPYEILWVALNSKFAFWYDNQMY